MIDPVTHLALHHTRAAELRAEAEAHRLATEAHQARQPRNLRARLGWTLVEVGLRIASAPRMTVTPAH
ncbi:hypothetical protein Save01_02193 [Streptomyces avermitilis]|uniref:Uncharacterized protein n=1 Tax=Streptomyces avermitilis TaxID=33903 RepID=A0A4D4MQU0_STRAX|nr:hypothetical protein [Streptomyces sp. SID5469]BBJ53255.1 hypothetical protein SAVMC3_58840 [Streptomyces avermitilis]GDY65266.1 hypothetical protein SAV14893_046590 [Streptomyces avermitilis]GDY74520.1 hypothetical protein SAV31267_040050 [Streptomyces avermitilis]GDY83569.1 hypothetical protein SAVCW2_27680 [Streptomyces avermitilis]